MKSVIAFVISVFLILYASYPSSDGSAGLALLYALGIIAGICILVFCWSSFWSAKSEDKTEISDVVKKQETKKIGQEDKLSLFARFIVFVASAALAYGLYQYQLANVSELIKNVPIWYFYIPLSGLIMAMAVMVLTVAVSGMRWWVDLSVFPAFFLFLAIGMWNHWFMPHTGDVSVHFWYVLIGALVMFIAITRISILEWYTQGEFRIFFPCLVIAVFIPQMFL